MKTKHENKLSVVEAADVVDHVAKTAKFRRTMVIIVVNANGETLASAIYGVSSKHKYRTKLLVSAAEYRANIALVTKTTTYQHLPSRRGRRRTATVHIGAGEILDHKGHLLGAIGVAGHKMNDHELAKEGRRRFCHIRQMEHRHRSKGDA